MEMQLFQGSGFVILAALLLLSSCIASAGSVRQHDDHNIIISDTTKTSRQQNLPNFIVLLTDDLDWTLGGMNASTLRRTRELIGDAGKVFSNWFVQTPVCCPSRAELLTGKMFHNLQIHPIRPDSMGGCMHIDVASNASHPFYERDYFAQYFADLNYSVGIFGKHLNNDNPTDFIPKGVDTMLINGGGTYLNPTFTFGTRHGGRPHQATFDNCTENTGMPCYSTAVIGNASLAWIQKQEQRQQNPYFALISVKAPHILDGPGFPKAIPAPWYENVCIPEVQAPRTPNYNYSATDHHWVVRTQLPLTETEAANVDDLYVSRLKSLLSVDDLVQDILTKRKDLSNTYVIFTSDNGYRLGQFRMPQCKLHAYENDIRVPMMMRGPGIVPGSRSSLFSTHVNLMPTLLGMAMGEKFHIPNTMDGTNLAPWIVNKFRKETNQRPLSSVLIEYQSLGNVVRYNHTIDAYNHSFLALRIIRDKNNDEEENVRDIWSYVSPSGLLGEQHLLCNFKYVEYYDSRQRENHPKDWRTPLPPFVEREVFDLDRDPYELINLVSQVSTMLLQALHFKLYHLWQCQGYACREEHATGLKLDLFSMHSGVRTNRIEETV